LTVGANRQLALNVKRYSVLAQIFRSHVRETELMRTS
jgi:hypothetical protein